MCRRRWNIGTYLEVEHARLRGVVELGILSTLLEQSVDLRNTHHGQRYTSLQHRRNIELHQSHLEKLVVGRGLGKGAAVLDGLLELGGFGDHIDG